MYEKKKKEKERLVNDEHEMKKTIQKQSYRVINVQIMHIGKKINFKFHDFSPLYSSQSNCDLIVVKFYKIN